MHLEVLVEGTTELTALSILMSRIIGPYREPHTWTIHKHRGIGSLPEDPTARPNPLDPTLLHNLPSKLRAYGKEDRADLLVVVLVDLDDHPDCRAFKQQLTGLLAWCDPKPNCLFRIAIEELEAWYLGDREALLKAYPEADPVKLEAYQQDSQCRTWETLADILHPGGIGVRRTAGVTGKRSPSVLNHKMLWARTIAPEMDVERNRSGSFQCFRDGLRRLTA